MSIPAKDLMKVTITVFEGIQYTVGKIDFDGNTIFTKQELRNYHGEPESSAWTRARSTRPGPTRRRKRNRTRNCPRSKTTSSASPIFTARAAISTSHGHARAAGQRRKRQNRHPLPHRGGFTVVRGADHHPGQQPDQGQGHPPRIAGGAGRDLRQRARRLQQEAPRKSPVLRKGRHFAPGHHGAQSQEHGRHGRGKAHRVGHLRRRLQLGRQPSRVCRNHRRATSISSTSPTSPAAAKNSAFGSSTVWSVRTPKSNSRSLGSWSSGCRWATISSITTPPTSRTYYNERNFGASVSLARAFGQFWSGSITYTLQDFDLYNFASNSSPQLLQGARLADG